MARPRVGEMDDKKRQFGMWLGLPEECRDEDERTMERWAIKHNLSPITTSRWKNDPMVKDIAKSAVKEFGGNDKLEIVRSMIQKAKDGSFQHQRLYLEWQGEIGVQVRKDNTPKEITVKYVTKE